MLLLKHSLKSFMRHFSSILLFTNVLLTTNVELTLIIPMKIIPHKINIFTVS